MILIWELRSSFVIRRYVAPSFLVVHGRFSLSYPPAAQPVLEVQERPERCADLAAAVCWPDITARDPVTEGDGCFS